MADTTTSQGSNVRVVCSKCRQAPIRCFPGTHEGLPVLGRFYCQRDRRQVIVVADDLVIELPDDFAAAGDGRPGARGWTRAGVAGVRAWLTRR